jgi:predicted transcriptional regulator
MSNLAASAKQQMITILQQQPEDSTYDELLRELAFSRMIDRGLDDVAAGRTIENEEVRRQIKTWQE